MKKNVLVIIGTRPEALKLFPVVYKLNAWDKPDEPSVCVTAQHRDLLDPILAFSKIKPDFDLDVMKANQSLDQLSSRLLLAIGEVYDRVRPDRVVVQGDTTSAMVGALAAYYRRIPVSHVEAGLRSGNIYEPWPEEVNRKIITQIADQHFAPTARAAEMLYLENAPRAQVHVTGNTIIDALLACRAMIEADPGLSVLGPHARRAPQEPQDHSGDVPPQGEFWRPYPTDRRRLRAHPSAPRCRHRPAAAPKPQRAGRPGRAVGFTPPGRGHTSPGISRLRQPCWRRLTWF